MELRALFAAIDDHILSCPGEPAPAELFMLREIDGHLAVGYLWSGLARELPDSLVPEAGLLGLVLAARGWAAPMEGPRPSQNPDRRRVRLLTLVFGSGAVITSIQTDDVEEQFLEGGEGDVPERLRRCWARRPDGAAYTARTREV